MASQINFDESCKYLQKLALIEDEDIPQLPPRKPRYDDETLGVNFIRTRLAEVELNNLTLPRTYFGRSEINQIGFRNTDLSESVFCWNDFTRVIFQSADLSQADLRASIFVSCSFESANLSMADLRHSTFDQCSFTNANMNGTKITYSWRWVTHLSLKQLANISWQKNHGVEPDGG